MPWDSAKLEELYRRVTGALTGTYRPLDGIPYFRFLYRPEAELQALVEFRLFVRRLRANGFEATSISLVEVLREAVGELLGVSEAEIYARLKDYERVHPHRELALVFSEHLPDGLASCLLSHLREYPPPACIVLLRAGALFPFVRVSSIFSRLEGKTRQVIVVPYPGDQEGAMLGERSFDLAAGYYRGEVL